MLEKIKGPLREDVKMQLVAELYTTEKLKGTDYYKQIKNHLKYVKSFEDHEQNKNEVKKRFRNIESKTVIPMGVYEANQKEIHQHIDILSKPYDKDMSTEERKDLKVQKTIARSNLMDFTLSVPNIRINDNIVEYVPINEYESIPLFNCKYSSKIGLEYIKKYHVEKENPENYFF